MSYDWFVPFLPSILGVAFMIYMALRKERFTPSQVDEGVDQVERKLGARFPGRRSGSDSRSAYGTIGDMTVAITLEPVNAVSNIPLTDLVVVVEGPRIPRSISFGKERDEAGDVATGDPYFDDMVKVHGEPAVVLAMLDKGLRQKIDAFVGDGGTLRSGRLRVQVRPDVPEVQIPDLVRTTGELAEALCSASTGGVCARLARNAADDPLPDVRRLNLMKLQEKFTASPEALAVSRKALADTSPAVRLAAARFLRAEVETLEALVRDREVPEQDAAEAVALLAARLAPERAGPLLVEIVKLRTGFVQRQAVEELGRLRYAPAFGPLIVVLENTGPAIAVAAAGALAALNDPRAEPTLLGILGREDAKLRLAAALALRTVGSVRSVAPLLELMESRDLDDGERFDVSRAIAAIQSRLVGAGAGQLSVATAASESGRVTIASDETGALSLAADPKKEE